MVILSTTDPRELRKTVEFQPVADYPHLKGALYRKVILEDKYIGSIATYLVVLNDLPICALNAPLLLLTTKKKKDQFCEWLLSDVPEITLEEKRSYLLYLLEHHLIKNQEVEKQIMYDLFGQPDHSWLFNHFDERSEEERKQFLQQVHKRILHAETPVEVALQVVETEEQRRELLARLQQMGPMAAK